MKKLKVIICPTEREPYVTNVSDTDKSKDCGSCKWHEDFNGVCFNGDSERCAGYTDSDESCGEWEGKA